MRVASMTCVAIGLLACSQTSVTVSGAGTDAFPPAVFRLLECIECIDGERDTVLAMGAAAVPSLRRAVVDGPAPGRMARLDSTLRAIRTPADTRLAEAAIAEQKASFRALYFRRGADALGAIGGDSARAALCQARLADGVPAWHRQFADSALARMGATCT
jgi:hypothetical protein